MTRIQKFYGRKYTRYIFIALILQLFILPLFIREAEWGLAEEKTGFKPLFPIRLEHDFPKPHETFEETKDLILKHYYSDNITEEALYWAAIQGMLRHISPPENPELGKIWTAEEYNNILNKLKGVQVSIGIKSSFNPGDGSLTVKDVLKGSPAESILKPFDRILRINARSLKDKSLQEINALLKGEEETEVTLTINRNIKIFDVTLKFEKFETQNLIVTGLTETIALVEIKRFTADISKKLKDELKKLTDQGFKGLIIDLRNDTGGVFIESLRIIELFLPEKKILSRTLQRETKLQNYTSANKEPFVFDISILVNRHTASSAEILASALQDHRKALIVGTRTFGKAVFEKTFTLKNDDRVKFITGAMYTPKGKSWQNKGVTPDFLVEQDDKTLESLLNMEPGQRFKKDVAMITAFKLLTR